MPWTEADVHKYLRTGDREPILEVYAVILEQVRAALADPAHRKENAERIRKQPDRWLQGLAVLGRQAGIAERLEVSGTLYADVAKLSDAELERELAKRQGLTIEQLRARALPASHPDQWESGAEATP